MLEYIFTSLVIFVPLAWVAFKWLRKIGLEPEAAWAVLLAALVLVESFPYLALHFHPVAFAVFNAGVCAGAGWFLWNKGRRQEMAVGESIDECVFAGSGIVTGADTDDAPTDGIVKAQEEEKMDGRSEMPPGIEAQVLEEYHAATLPEEDSEGRDQELSDVREVPLAVEGPVEEPVEKMEAQISETEGAAETGGELVPLDLEEADQPPVEEEEEISQGTVEQVLVSDLDGEEGEGAESSIEGITEDDIEDLIEKGFTAKFEGDYSRAAANFSAAWREASDPELFYLLGTELVTLYRELGDYDRALATLEILAQDKAIDRQKAEAAAWEKRLLEITRRLLEEIGMPGLPASQIPRSIRHKARLEFDSEYLR